MPRLTTPTRDAAPAASQPLLDGVFKTFGVIPNLFRVYALSPSALGGLLGLVSANSKSLDVRTRERIAIAVAQVNGCDYCLSAHTFIGTKLAKITPEDAALNRKGASTDAKASAAVAFAAKVAELRGHVDNADLAAVKAAGYSEAQIEVAQTEIDFPIVHTAQAA